MSGKYIPSMMRNRIEKDHFMDPKFQKIPEKHPFQIANEQIENANKEILNRIKINCSIFKATRPKEWQTFEEDMKILYSRNLEANKRSPLDFIGINKDQGVTLDSNYWSLTKAYSDGQVAVLDSLFELFKIDPRQIIELDLNPPKPVQENFLKKSLRSLKSLINK
jgi:hypothetical protein